MSSPVMDSPRARFGDALRQAIRGVEQDYTCIPVRQAVLLLAVPMVLEMVMESLFAVVDVFWVTHLGADAVATVGLTESVLTLVAAVILGVSMSATAMVARRVGEKDLRGAATAAMQSVWLGVAVGIAAGVPGTILAGRVLGWMGASPAIVSTGRGYAAVMFGGCLSLVLLYINNAIFRGAGDPVIAMRVLWGANLINIVLAPFLVFGLGPFPRMGVTGAGVATVIGRSLGVLYQFWMMGGGRSRVHLTRGDLRPVWSVMARLVRVSASGALQFTASSTSWVALVRIVSEFGSAALAGYTIGLRVFVFLMLPAWGLSGAAATMTGQNLGAGRPDRAERAVWLTAFYTMLYMGAVAVVFLLLPEPMVRLFGAGPEVATTAVNFLRIVSLGNLGYAYGMVMVQAFNGAGDTVTPTIINYLGFWALEIPLAWMLANHLGLGASGVFTAVPLAECSVAVAGVLLFRRGRWKTTKL